jgi:hypothetical protein
MKRNTRFNNKRCHLTSDQFSAIRDALAGKGRLRLEEVSCGNCMTKRSTITSFDSRGQCTQVEYTCDLEDEFVLHVRPCDKHKWRTTQ